MNRDDGLAGLLYAVVIVALLIGYVARGFIPADGDALRAAQVNGFRDARITETHRLAPMLAGCDGGDATAWDVAATNSSSDAVNIVICSGWPFKGMTVRVK